MYKPFTKEVLKVGDKVNVQFWTDRNPGTIVEVRRKGREIVVQEDKAVAEVPDGMDGLPMGHQSWKIERNPNGPTRTFTWRTTKGREVGYIMKGASLCAGRGNQVSPGWSYYYDWSF